MSEARPGGHDGCLDLGVEGVDRPHGERRRSGERAGDTFGEHPRRAADGGGRVVRLAVELLDEAGHHEQQREHDGRQHDDDDEADEAMPEIANGQQDHEPADQPASAAHAVTVSIDAA